MRRSVKITLTAGLLSTFFAAQAFAGEWQQSGEVWHYVQDDGTYAKGWQNIKEQNNDNTHWYYFDPDTGVMATGWKQIKEENTDAVHYYFFDETNGAMWVSGYTPDGNYVNADGVWLEDGAEAGSGQMEQAQTGDASAEGADTDTVEAGSNGLSEAYAEQLVELINARRRDAGLSEFTVDAGLKAGAETRAQELTVDYSSLRPDGNKSKYAIDGWENYSALVEIKDRAASPEATIDDWYTEGSSESMLLTDRFEQGGKNFSFTEIGAGCCVKDGELYFAVFLNGHVAS